MTNPFKEGDANGIWKYAAVGSVSLLIGLSGAYLNLFATRGVTRQEMADYIKDHPNYGVSRSEMEAYVKEYSPYIMDKRGLEEHQQQQDRDINYIRGRQETVFDRLNKLEAKVFDGNK